VGSNGFPEIDQFRPKAGSYDAKTRLSLDHYWWLAYDWRNLYLVCQVCNANKGSKFPVRNQRVKVPKGDHAQHNATWFWEELKTEQPLLLDPCAEDVTPGDHLLFDDNTGLVAGLTEEGKITIEILKLNRERLVHERKLAMDETIAQLRLPYDAIGGLERNYKDKLRKLLRKLLSPSQPFLGARKQCVGVWFGKNRKRLSSRIGEKFESIVFDTVGASAQVPKAIGKAIVEKSVVKQKRKQEAKAVASKLEGQYITAIELHNFRAIEHLTIEFSAVQENHTPWLVLLGENGIGKSSILKAVALALMDKEHYKSLNLDASTFVRYGHRSGYVRVHTTAHTTPFQLNFERGRRTFVKANNNRLQTILLGYGGTRLLPRGKHRPAPFSGFTRIENLFDPFLPLMSAEAWLLALKQKAFGYGARVIKDLLIRDDETRLIRRSQAVKVKSSSAPNGVPLEELSDGYQSMVALGTDIMRVLMKGWELAEKAQGIVLLDEIDVHLHPRWKMQVTNSLQRAFPRVQFIVTTHDPLCLKGTRSGDVRVLSREEDSSPVCATRVDVPPGATADQLLTGFWFGLSSTIDNETLDLIEAHHTLLRSRKTSLNLRRRRYLEEELHRRLGVYADTSLDRMAQSVASELMRGDYVSLGPAERMNLRNQIQQQVARKERRKT